MDQSFIDRLIENSTESDRLRILGSNYFESLSRYYKEYHQKEVSSKELLVEQFEEHLLENKMLLERLVKILPKPFLHEITGQENPSKRKLKQRLLEKIGLSEPKVETRKTDDSIEVNSLNSSLHDFQERIRRKVVNQIFNGNRRFLIQMPTGAGKTRTACEITIDFIRLSSATRLRDEKMNVIWIAQSRELCQQAFDTFNFLQKQKLTREIQCCKYWDYHSLEGLNLEKPSIIFASIQKLQNSFKTDLWNKIRENNYLIIVDEAHRSVTSKWQSPLMQFTCQPGSSLIGLTATPGTSEDKRTSELANFYSCEKISLVDEKYTTIKTPITYLREKSVLAKIERKEINSTANLEQKVQQDENGEMVFSDATLHELTINPYRNHIIKNLVQEQISRDRKILIFSCGLEHNRVLKQILSLDGIKSEFVDSEASNKWKRGKVIQDFKEGSLSVLINYGVLTTGFDAPNTDVCVIARPVKSIIDYSQMVGRILRGAKNIAGWDKAFNKTNYLFTIKDNLDHGDYDKLYNSFNDFWEGN